MKTTTDSIASPSTKMIVRTQKYHSLKFPKDYLEFLKENNGGVPFNRVFTTKNNEKVIDRFLPLMDDPNSDQFMGQYDVDVVWSQVSGRLCDDPDQYGGKLIPIVNLEFGDLVCLDFRKKPDSPEVVVWYHEQSKEYKPVTEKIADSFTEFLGKLRPLEPYKGTAVT
jgi:SMI1-KNR4 cell-wall